MKKSEMPITKREALISWCKYKKTFSSVDINHYKQTAYHLRADREVRDLTQAGILRRLSNEEITLRGLRKVGHASIGWWEAV